MSVKDIDVWELPPVVDSELSESMKRQQQKLIDMCSLSKEQIDEMTNWIDVYAVLEGDGEVDRETIERIRKHSSQKSTKIKKQ